MLKFTNNDMENNLASNCSKLHTFKGVYKLAHMNGHLSVCLCPNINLYMHMRMCKCICEYAFRLSVNAYGCTYVRVCVYFALSNRFERNETRLK